MSWFKRRLAFLLGWMILLLLIAAVLQGVSIDMRMPEKDRHPLFLTGKERKAGMLDYMKKKYGEDFVDGEACGGQFGKAYGMRRVYSVRYPEKGVLVRVTGEEGEVFQDNYLAYLLQDEIEECMKSIAGEAFGECKVFYKIPELVFPAEFPADMNVDAFLKYPLSMVRIYIYVKDSASNNSPLNNSFVAGSLPADSSLERQAQIDAFLTALSGKGYVIGGVISYPAGEEMYEMITENNFAGDIYHGYKSRAEAVFSMKRGGELSYLRWNSFSQ